MTIISCNKSTFYLLIGYLTNYYFYQSILLWYQFDHCYQVTFHNVHENHHYLGDEKFHDQMVDHLITNCND